MKFQAVKGTRDFYPQDMAIRNWITDAWRRVSLRNGFEEYDGPILECLDLYRAKSGEGIVSELFHLTDRGDRELAIRPEMTPTLARMINARAGSLPRPIKWFSMPRLCRAERPQRGRLREFFQWNVDIVGLDDAVTDAECIFAALDFFREIGLTPADMVMKINCRALLAALLAARGFEPARHAAIFPVLDKRDKLPPEAFAEAVEKVCTSAGEREVLLSISQARGPEGLETVARAAAGHAGAEAALARLRNVLGLLDRMEVGEYCSFDMGVVRGLAYYTGTVFEAFGRGGFSRAICGGGRYDQLLESLGGPPMSGVGFGTSDVVIQELLEELGRMPPEAGTSGRAEVFLIDAAPEMFDAVLALAARLRRRGVRADFSYRRQALGKQLKQASAAGAARVVIVGEEYKARGQLVIKDMSTGRQQEVPADAFCENPRM